MNISQQLKVPKAKIRFYKVQTGILFHFQASNTLEVCLPLWIHQIDIKWGVKVIVMEIRYSHGVLVVLRLILLAEKSINMNKNVEPVCHLYMYMCLLMNIVKLQNWLSSKPKTNKHDTNFSCSTWPGWLIISKAWLWGSNRIYPSLWILKYIKHFSQLSLHCSPSYKGVNRVSTS